MIRARAGNALTIMVVASLLAGASARNDVAFERLEGSRVRVSIVYRSGGSPAEALLRLEAAAQRLCGGPGRAVGDGPLNVNKVPKNDPARRRGDTRLSADYRCLAEPAPR
jgi:hypothetical protein